MEIWNMKIIIETLLFHQRDYCPVISQLPKTSDKTIFRMLSIHVSEICLQRCISIPFSANAVDLSIAVCRTHYQATDASRKTVCALILSLCRQQFSANYFAIFIKSHCRRKPPWRGQSDRSSLCFQVQKGSEKESNYRH